MWQCLFVVGSGINSVSCLLLETDCYNLFCGAIGMTVQDACGLPVLARYSVNAHGLQWVMSSREPNASLSSSKSWILLILPHI